MVGPPYLGVGLRRTALPIGVDFPIMKAVAAASEMAIDGD